MGKFTFWLTLAGLVWLGWTLWRVGKRRAEGNERERSRNTPQAPVQPQPDEPEPMVSCQHCQLYLPKREAVEAQGGYFCSTAHRDQATRARNGHP